MASTMARTSCSEAFTAGSSGRTAGVSDEVLMQFLRPRIYRSTWAGDRQQEAPQQNWLWGLIFTQSERRDLNSTAPKRGRCFIDTYVSKPDRIGSYWLLWTGKHYGKHVRGGNAAAVRAPVHSRPGSPYRF